METHGWRAVKSQVGTGSVLLARGQREVPCKAKIHNSLHIHTVQFCFQPFFPYNYHNITLLNESDLSPPSETEGDRLTCDVPGELKASVVELGWSTGGPGSQP